MIKPAYVGVLVWLAAAEAGATEFAWRQGPATAGEAAQLFQSACLAAIPDFAGANALLDRLGFQSLPTVPQRRHPGKKLAVAVVNGAEAASCALFVEDIAVADLEAALAPLVESALERVARREMPDVAGEYALWTGEVAGRSVNVILSGAGSGSVVAVGVDPPR